ncbi:MAG: hypothetical protein IJO52_07585 [Clostridia bacterium]|nr:hypothetical protein [Clostridia bacterium]
MVKDTGSQYFDSAYFVIKSDLPQSCKDSDMLSEAHRMIDAYTKENQIGQPQIISHKKRSRTAVRCFFAAVILLAVLFAALIVVKILS